MENLKFADGKWTGTLIKRSDGSKHDGTFVVDEKKLTITVKGGFISKTFVWTQNVIDYFIVSGKCRVKYIFKQESSLLVL